MPATPKKRDVETLALVGVAALWLGLVVLARYVDVPDGWKASLPRKTFLIAGQLAAAAVGIGLTFAILAEPRAALALVAPRARGVVGAALLAPAVFVFASIAAIRIALPTLLAEARARGPALPRDNSGVLTRALVQSPLLTTLLVSVVLAAVTEELLFRGALWSAVERLGLRIPRAPDGARPPESRLRALALGFAPTLITALLFALMHRDLSGGAGIVRIVTTLCLGLACGIGRSVTGTIAAPIVLHLVHNTIVIGQGRRWFASKAAPLFEALPIPNRILALAAAGVIGFALLWLASSVARREGAPT